LPEVASRPLSEQVADVIVEMIATRALLPGERLAEASLAKRSSTSRVPVREAVKALDTQGIVISTPYRGTRVAEFDARHAEEVVAARIALETLIVRQAARNLREDPARLAGIDRVLSWMSDCVLTGDRFGINCADIEFHREVCLASDSAILVTLWGAMARHILIGFGLSNSRYPDSEAILAQHRGFRDLLVSGPLGALDSEVEDHILGRNIPIVDLPAVDPPARQRGRRNGPVPGAQKRRGRSAEGGDPPE
jgi:DNA-binding GntR family transcriptional regulator